jgi:citrate lyase subunit beta/citryl-CoA lyase
MREKARGIEVDEIVIELENAVVLGAKAQARANVVAALAAGGFACGSVAVRVNAPRTPWGHQDLIALGGANQRPRNLVIPKVQRGRRGVRRSVAGRRRVRGWPLRAVARECARGKHTRLWALDEITAASPRLEALLLGYADLGASLGRSRAGAAGLDRWLAVQDAVLAQRVRPACRRSTPSR